MSTEKKKQMCDEEIAAALLNVPKNLPPDNAASKVVLPCEPRLGGLYPKVDFSIWLRTCTRECKISAQKVSGIIPDFLTGESLMQNGPSKFTYGDQVVGHLFDGSGLVQKYKIERDGNVSYQCRFIRSRHFLDNLRAGKIVSAEFGTGPPKGKRGLYPLDKVMTDNTFISINPLGDDYFCFYESPFLNQFDPDTLATLRKVDLNRSLGLITHAAHPHYDEFGNMISVGCKLGLRGPEFTVNKFPVSSSRFSLEEKGQILATVACNRATEPGYMHSFAMTNRYFVLIEQPLGVSVVGLIKCALTGRPLMESLRWREKSGTVFHVIDRVSGEPALKKVVFQSKAFFFLHTINAYEENGHLIVDILCFDNPNMLNSTKIAAIQTAQSDAKMAQLFHNRALRFVLPLKNAMKGNTGDQKANLVTLQNTTAKAKWSKNSTVWVEPQELCNIGCETPTINYGAYSGKKYRYFYAITTSIDDPNGAGFVHKIDVETGVVKSWGEDDLYCAEPMFVPRPDAVDEDDGGLLSSAVKATPDDDYTALIIIDAKTMTELARAEFRLGPDAAVPKPLHGFFTGNNFSRVRRTNSIRM